MMDPWVRVVTTKEGQEVWYYNPQRRKWLPEGGLSDSPGCRRLHLQRKLRPPQDAPSTSTIPKFKMQPLKSRPRTEGT
ncbi:hypothetical protein chiPu_0020013, partial [Chiloscyllium punctatum]|nr:hypothetical protein [Chiloscyllium punctatum]